MARVSAVDSGLRAASDLASLPFPRRPARKRALRNATHALETGVDHGLDLLAGDVERLVQGLHREALLWRARQRLDHAAAGDAALGVALRRRCGGCGCGCG